MHDIIGPSLSKLTTIRLGGRALILLFPENLEDLEKISEIAREYGAHTFIIGRGSNILAEDCHLPLVLVNLKEFKGIEEFELDEHRCELRVQAGVSLPVLLRYCLQRGLSGLEGLVGIPGNVGGACVMNAGSYGDSIGTCITGLEIWKNNAVFQVDKEHIIYSYRQLRIRNEPVLPLVLGAKFTLTRADKSVIFTRMNHNFIQKKSTQPVTAWSAGCAFKNPPQGPSAGFLLEQAGFKGRQLGGMAFSPLHANFLINTGTGDSGCALELLGEAQETVHTRFGITLEPEIRIIRCH